MREVSTVYETPESVMNRGGQPGNSVSEQQPYDVLETSMYETVPTVEGSNDFPDATYSMVGPEADYSEQRGTAEAAPYMHYEMVKYQTFERHTHEVLYLQEVFEIYSTPVSVGKGENLSTRIRRV